MSFVTSLWTTGLFLCVLQGTQGAALVTCSSPDTNVSGYNLVCTLGANGLPLNPQQPSEPLVFSGNSSSGIVDGQYQESGLAFFPGFPVNNSGPYPMAVSASWDDQFTLPASPAGDILKITAYLGGCGMCPPDNNPGAGSITIGPNSTVTDTSICDINQGCRPNTYTISASGVDMVETRGSYRSGYSQSLQGEPGGQSQTQTFETIVTIDRFLSDGVTPDPFSSAPEPSTLLLSAGPCVGLFVLGAWCRAR